MVKLGLLTAANPHCADEESKLRDATTFSQSPNKPVRSPAHQDPGPSLAALPFCWVAVFSPYGCYNKVPSVLGLQKVWKS